MTLAGTLLVATKNGCHIHLESHGGAVYVTGRRQYSTHIVSACISSERLAHVELTGQLNSALAETIEYVHRESGKIPDRDASDPVSSASGIPKTRP